MVEAIEFAWFNLQAVEMARSREGNQLYVSTVEIGAVEIAVVEMALEQMS